MDLLSPRPFWPIRDGLPATFPTLDENISCDVAVVGAGISGAFVASRLSDAGLHVVVVDRREAAHGSTAGNTGLMLYEIDVMLHRLAQRIGWDRAKRAYLRSRDAVEGLKRLTRRAHIDCEFERRPSLYLAAIKGHVSRLRREFEARRAAGLDVEWWSRETIAARSSLPHPAAILTHEAAQLDPYKLTYGLLKAAERAGVRVFDRSGVTRRRTLRRGVELTTNSGHRVRARHVVIATGYEAQRYLPGSVAKLHSTFALVTEPLAELRGWPGKDLMMWDTGDPYLYLRTLADRRAIIGGYDEPFYGPRARDRGLNAKASALTRRFKQFFPEIRFEVSTTWAGTFAVTRDGLPFIGQHPAVPHTWFALGFGGNGTTFSLIAAEIIRAGITGETDPDAELFAFGR